MLLTYLPLCVIVAVVSKKSIHKIYLFITIKKGILIPISLLTPEKGKKTQCCCLNFLILIPLLCDYEIRHGTALAAGNSERGSSSQGKGGIWDLRKKIRNHIWESSLAVVKGACVQFVQKWLLMQ